MNRLLDRARPGCPEALGLAGGGGEPREPRLQEIQCFLLPARAALKFLAVFLTLAREIVELNFGAHILRRTSCFHCLSQLLS
jgi:hypothetical protein